MKITQLLLVIVAACFVNSTVVAAERKNILLLIGDDHGMDGGCFGNPAASTPNLDRLASQGTRFPNAFAAVSSCSPSRSVILTGLYNHTNGQYGLAHATNNQRTQPFVMSLPRLLNDAGYRTALIGKNHVVPQEVYPYATEQQGGRPPQQFAHKATEFFQKQDDRPFFLVVGFNDPHRAFGTPPADRKEVTSVPAFLPDTPAVRDDLADYYGSVERLDRSVGAVLDALEQSGKADDTLVIYVSDNGMPFPGAKTNLYDPGVRLPFIIRAPQRPAGVVSEAMVSFIDITPTILEWSGAKTPEYKLPGRSLLPLVGQARIEDRPVFASHTVHEIWMYYPMRMIRTRKHKLIWNLAHTLEYPVAGDINRSPSWQAARETPAQNGKTPQQYLHRPRFELYDLESDPGETKNLADDPSFASVRSSLLEQLKQMMKQTNDQWLGRPTVEESE